MLGCTERGFPAIRGEFIIIVSEVSQEIDFPFRGQLVRDVSLQIDKFRVVFSVCIHGTQNRPTAFKAETRYLGKFTDMLKKGIDPKEAVEKATGSYGRFADAVKYIDPRQE